MLVLLVFAGQSLALAVSPCRMSDRSPAGLMDGDASAHASHGHDHGMGVGAAAKSDASDCCAKGDSGCSMSGCVSVTMMSTPQQQLALPFIRIEPPVHPLDLAQSQYPSSLYRPPIYR